LGGEPWKLAKLGVIASLDFEFTICDLRFTRFWADRNGWSDWPLSEVAMAGDLVV
jgi:hypothetical protein